jgi:hypothetical protein
MALNYLSAYVAALPKGLDSHPECKAKASVSRTVITRGLFNGVTLPAPLQALIDAPPPVTSWIPEVHHNALMSALVDTHFKGNEEAFFGWVREANRALFRGPLYRMMFFLLSPDRLLNGLSRRWEQFRQGSTLELLDNTASSAVLRLTAPMDLHSSQSAKGLAIAFAIALECSGARKPTVELDHMTRGQLVYVGKWA